MTRLQKVVFASAAGLFIVWLAANFGRLTAVDEGVIRFVLGGLFALLILFRPKLPGTAGVPASPARIAAGIVAGTILAVVGLVFLVRQFEWLGLVIVLYACLRWSLPPSYTHDIRLALLLLYWIHPLPGRIFGSFQLLMQALSVKGAEWLLHCFNIRVWADGLFLRMGFRTFGVPEACSGMRTGVTVFLVTLGVTMLFRFRWYAAVFFLAAGTVQVLLLNILRIAGMVYWSPRMPPEWGDHFLHDTLGIFLLVSILLVQIEASGWKIAKERRARHRREIAEGWRETKKRATTLPRFWKRLARGWLRAAAVAVLIGGVAFGLVKRRPEHRQAMIRDVAEGLVETNPEAAERALRFLLKSRPADRELLSMQVTVLVLRGKFEESLAAAERLPGELTIGETVMKSWALMSLGRAADAMNLVARLPEEARNLPGVAIIRAEYAARENRPFEVGRNIVAAMRSPRLAGRVRSLFPYLALHEQWAAIDACGANAPPYQELSHAVLAIHASLKMNDINQAADLLKYVLEKWPNHPLYLGSLFSVAWRRPGGPWEDLFAENLRRNVAALDADMLAHYLTYCFQLSRPDLGWLVYLRLRGIDPSDPALQLAPARFGAEWFRFRRRQIGIGAGSEDELIDLKPFYRRFGDVEPFRSFWRRVPLAEELAGADFDATRDRYLRRCVEELQRRERAGALPLRMEMIYPTALAMLGRHADAHARLAEIERKYPDMREEVLLQHAVFYNQQADWQHAYEALREYFASVPQPGLTAHLIMVNAMMNLNMGLCAMEVAERAERAFPQAAQVSMAVAAIWDVFGYKEEALFVLVRRQLGLRSRAMAQLLYDTRRYNEAENVGRALGITVRRDPEREKQPLLPVPAEHSVARKLPLPLTPGEMDAAARKMEGALREGPCPFLSRQARLEEGWYRSHGSAAASNPGVWEAAGRDAAEKATALHRLALLLARQKNYAPALEATRRAAAFMPASAILQRMLVALTAGEPETVEEARRTCSDDPDIWLAWLVTRTRRDGRGPWSVEEIERAVSGNVFPVGTMVSAGDYLLRKGMAEAAAAAARDAIARCQGYLPAYVLGLKCAVALNDLRWALLCALRGVENALDPAPFYMTIVEIKSAGRNVDHDLVVALEHLREHVPEEPSWAERLAQIHFWQHDPERALAVLSPVIAEDIRGVRVQSLLLAAEAARLDGEPGKAIGILETAYAMYPEKLWVLNNLVYNLAQDKRTIQRARDLLPSLLAMGGESFVVYDTAATVYLRSGQIESARQYMDRALSLLDENGYGAQEVSLNAAEILIHSGEYDDARSRLEELRRTPGVPHLVDMNARQLLEQIRDITGE